MTTAVRAAHELSAAELSAHFASGELSPVEVLRDLIVHIERWEPRLAALWAFDPEAALAMARDSETRWVRREPRSPLEGVPVTIKENVATKGVAVPLGTAATTLVPAAEDAPPAARLREAGCVFLGKTTMPDYGMLSSGLSSFHALTRNPWDLNKNPGGSSAGAGAAAAAGYGPLHVGTDIGGSIRLPAGWCGVFGLKPSGGRVPTKPPYVGRVAGPMTRSAADAALMMAALARPDVRDTTSLPAEAIAWESVAEAGADSLTAELKGMKIGLWLDAGWGLPVQAETEAAVRQAARLFEAHGATVEPLPAFATREMADGIDRFFRIRSWLDIEALPADKRALVLPYIRKWVASGARLSGAQVFHAWSQVAAFREAAVAACRPYRFVISPTAPVASFAADWASPLNDPERPFEHIAFTLPFNMSEQPAASVSAGHTSSGLPIGLQIIGARHDDLGVLRMARTWEAVRPAQRPWPRP